MTDQKKSTVLIALLATTAFFVLRPANATSPLLRQNSERHAYSRPVSQPVPTIRYNEIVLPTIGTTAEHRIVTDDPVGSVSVPIPDDATVQTTADLLANVAADPAAREGLIAWISERLPSATGALLALFTALLGVLLAARERVAAATRETWETVTRTVTTPVTTIATRMVERLVDVVTSVPRTVVDTVTRMVERMMPVMRMVPRTIVETVEQIIPRTVEVLRQVPRTVVDTVTRVVPRVVEVIRSVPRTIADWVTSLVATTVPVVRTVTDMVPRMVEETFAYPVQVARTVYDTVMTSVREFVQVTKQVAREVVEWVQPNGTVVANPSGAGFLPAGGNYAGLLGALPGDGLFRIGSTNDPGSNLYLRRGNTIINLTGHVRQVGEAAATHALLPGQSFRTYGEFEHAALQKVLQELRIHQEEYRTLSVFNPSAFADARISVTEGAVASLGELAGVKRELDARRSATQTNGAAPAFQVPIELPRPGTLATSVGATPGAYQMPQPVTRTVYDTVVETVERWVEKPVQVARTVFDTVWKTGTRMVEQIVPVVRTVTEMVTTAVPTLIERLRTMWETVTDTVTEFVTETAQVARTVYDTVRDTVTEWIRVPVTTARTVYDAVTEYVRETVPVVTSVPRTVYDTVTTTVPTMVAEAYEETREVTTTVTERVKKTIAPSATATAWALVGVRGEMEKVAKKVIAGMMERKEKPLEIPINEKQIDQHQRSRTSKAILFGITHPVATVTIGWPEQGVDNLSTYAANFTINSNLPNETPDEYASKNNAFRHVLWQAMIARTFGEEIAYAAGEAHEDGDYPSLPKTTNLTWKSADKSADILNNKIGRMLAVLYPNASRKELALKTLKYFRDEGLFIGEEDAGHGVEVNRHQLSPEEYRDAYENIYQLNNNGRKDASQ